MKYFLIISFLFSSFLNLNGQEISTKELRKHKPVNLDEAVFQLTKNLPDTTQQWFLSMTEMEFIGNTHMGLGLWIRNNWGLWRGGKLAKYFKSMGIFHPDDMSGIILRCYYRQLHNQDWELEEQIKVCQNYWKGTQEHHHKMKTDTAYQKRIQYMQDSLKREVLSLKKLEWKAGSVIIGNLWCQSSFFSSGAGTKVKGVIIEWQGENVVMKITQYFDKKKKGKVIKCNNIEDDIFIIHNNKGDEFSIFRHGGFRLVEEE